MISHRPTDTGRTAPGRGVVSIVALVAFALAVAGCSSSGGKQLTAAELSQAMPTAADIGTGFHRDKAGESEKDNDTKLKVSATCQKLLNNDDTGKVKAKREFKDGKDREVDVSATVTKDTLASVEKTAKTCSRVPFTSGSTKGLITFKVTSMEGVGDDADAIDLTLAVTEPISLSIKGHGVVAKRGDVGISVLGLDGVDDQANVTPIDNAIVDKAARDLDQKIKDAQG